MSDDLLLQSSSRRRFVGATAAAVAAASLSQLAFAQSGPGIVDVKPAPNGDKTAIRRQGKKADRGSLSPGERVAVIGAPGAGQVLVARVVSIVATPRPTATLTPTATPGPGP